MKLAPSGTAQAIYKMYQDREDGYKSKRIGASKIGEECSRKLWYGFRWCYFKKFDGQKLRLFETGHSQEARIIQNLRDAKFEVWDTEPNSKRQIMYKAINNHFIVMLDGVVKGVPEAPKALHVLEIKTCNDKAFKKAISPEHIAQCQIGMHFSKLDRALYLRLNKNDESISTTRLHYDKKMCIDLLAKAEFIIYTPEPPPPTESFMCKWCDYIDICQNNQPVTEKNCRTCLFSLPADDGNWLCTKAAQARGLINEKPYTYYKEDYIKCDVKPCDHYIMLPSLSLTTEYAERWVENCLS